MATFKKLPLYELNVEADNQGIFCVSLVDRPAVESNWQAFANQERKINFTVEDESEHRILGVIARADFPIYRRDEQQGEYYVIFSKEAIETMARKMLDDGFQNRINLQHTEDTFVNSVKMEQLFIKNTDKGISPKGFEDIADGSLFGQYRVEDERLWEAVKDGTFKGFSLEGYFDVKPAEEEITTLDQLLDYLGL